MRDSGVAIMGMGQASGEGRALKAIENALASPLLNSNDITGAKSILINIASGRGENELTMDELGGALGFEGKNMSVRISQYETGARIPGEDMILKLADALHCNYKAISDYSLGAAEDIIETLF